MSSALVVTLLCAVLTGAHSWYLPDHKDSCAESFQNAFKEVLKIKKTCKAAVFEDCCQITQAAKAFGITPQSAVFDIRHACHKSTSVYFTPTTHARCDLESNNGGWIVLIRQTNSATQEKFARTWKEYENGFGDLNGEFFYGLKNMHCLTTQQEMEVELEYSNNNGARLVIAYGKFRVDGPQSNYKLYVSEYISGGRFFDYHNGQPFSTRDRDNDASDKHNCAADGQGGWWYTACYHLIPTSTPGPVTYTTKSGAVRYHNVEMRVRPKTCKKQLEQYY